MLSVERWAALRRGLLRSTDQRATFAPAGIVAGEAAAHAVAAGTARPLAGQSLAFREIEVLVRRPDRIISVVAPLEQLADWAVAEGLSDRVAEAVDQLSAPRDPLPGCRADRPLAMGVINVTPDSFSDGGQFHRHETAIAHGRRLIEEGANIIDIGGESTRPGAEPVSPQQEIDRVLPVIEALSDGPVPISIDSRRAAVMGAALAAGASVVNDVTALAGDPASLALVAAADVPVILMHMQGQPQTMQADPQYDFAPLDVYEFLEARVAACFAAGIPRGRIVVDPGIGFGKTDRHNLEILARLGLLHGLGCQVLLGASRKSMIGRLSRGEAADRRLGGSIAAAIVGVEQGVQIIRAHDVAETRQALAIHQAIRAAG